MDFDVSWLQNDEFGERMEQIKAETQPLLFTGDIGDTIFVRKSQLAAAARSFFVLHSWEPSSRTSVRIVLTTLSAARHV